MLCGWTEAKGIICYQSLDDVLDAIDKNTEFCVTRKLNGSQLIISSEQNLYSRRTFLGTGENYIKTRSFQGTPLKGIQPLLEKVLNLKNTFQSIFNYDGRFTLLLYGEFIRKFGRNEYDEFDYEKRGIKQGSFFAFRLGLVFQDGNPPDVGAVFPNFICRPALGEGGQEYSLVLMSKNLQKIFQQHAIEPVHVYKTGKFNDLVQDEDLLQILLQKTEEGIMLTSASADAQHRILKFKILEEQSEGLAKYLANLAYNVDPANSHVVASIKRIFDAAKENECST